MTAQTLARVFDFADHLTRTQAGSPRPRVSMLWHGGEPLLMGVPFFEQILAFTDELAQQGVSIRHRIQTNLLAWDDELAEILTRLPGNLGLSSSAEPLGLNDRRLPGDGSYMGRWLDKLAEVQQAGFTPGLVCVVDGRIAKRPRDAYFYFKNLRPDSGVRFNPLYPRRREETATGPNALSPAAWGRFLIGLWDAWQEDDCAMRVEPLMTWNRAAGGGERRGACDMSGRCASGFLGISPDGTVSHCGRAMDAGILEYGNLNDDDFDTILESPLRREMLVRTDSLLATDCAGCPWWHLCHGGCAAQSWLHGHDWRARSAWCEGRKDFFAHSLGKTNSLSDESAGRGLPAFRAHPPHGPPPGNSRTNRRRLRVALPADSEVPAWADEVLWRIAPDVRELPGPVPGKPTGYEFEGWIPDEEVLEAMPEGTPVRLRITGESVAGLLRLRAPGPGDTRPVATIDAAAPGLLRAANVALGARFPVSITFEDPAKILWEELEECWQRFVHVQKNPVPVEPFVSTVRRAVQGEAFSLREIRLQSAVVELRLPERHGTDGLPPYDWFAHVDSFHRKTFAADTRCSTCPGFRVCGGFLELHGVSDCTAALPYLKMVDRTVLALRRDMAEARRPPASRLPFDGAQDRQPPAPAPRGEQR